MSEVPVWVERKFSFPFPVEVYPNLRVRLRGAPPRLEELTRGLPESQLTRRSAGKWSIKENVGHLLDLEPLTRKRVDEYLAGADVMSAADVSNRETHQRRYNRRPLADILAGFRRAREELVDKLEGLRPESFARLSTHPRLQIRMRLTDFLFFIAEHDDHHLARIWELRKLG